MSVHHGFLLAALILFILGPGCERPPADQGPHYQSSPPVPQGVVHTFAVHPLHNPKKLYSSYQPLVDYLNQHLTGARLELEASRDYGHFEAKYQARIPHILLPNPWQTLQAMKVGYHVIASAGAPEDFKGLFIVRRDSSLRFPADLKGRAVSYPSPTALAACILPQYFLFQHGINVRTEVENRYVGSQESSIMNVYLGQTAAGATWPPPWRAFQKDHPREARELKVLWETPSLLNNSVMVRDDLPPAITDDLRKALVHLHESREGRTILATMETTRFVPATDQDYKVVRGFVDRFERDVRQVGGQ
ncbi:MAG TPA: phosphate/phosphite/phosphonate ABC transporter substrate-binding protein [Geothrix sp.]|nr:phosphate/phosphite/phosphonate ABC transporter substrate-binding protein [Geothrix sp.]